MAEKGRRTAAAVLGRTDDERRQLLMMASSAELSYQRLNRAIWLDEGGDMKERWSKNYRFRRLRMAKKVRVKIPKCKNLLRRKARNLVKIVWSKICKRLKESQSHFGDLFAGNYVFMHVSPTPIKYGHGRSFVKNPAFLGY
ncbi:hypothetical protein C2S53_003323 [Perilla frutescens var. hirtella]|uniref:Uncharacterized protein n=1 Tax=Perilla frutescens var. hirtella TaxID=608512 RepID=A0AAD4PAQ8_PERFH|nr:hypothetical protein C2S53_003323 [Perilla frutescens var. hirtella]